MENQMISYYNTYTDKSDSWIFAEGYHCQYCGAWVNFSDAHHCCYGNSRITCYPYYHEDKTEKAFNLLKLFVEEEIIDEPKNYKKFCKLIEKMAELL